MGQSIKFMGKFIKIRVTRINILINLLDLGILSFRERIMGSLLSFYCQFFATQIIGGAKELVVLL